MFCNLLPTARNAAHLFNDVLQQGLWRGVSGLQPQQLTAGSSQLALRAEDVLHHLHSARHDTAEIQ
jgi:hypothetical protein